MADGGIVLTISTKLADSAKAAFNELKKKFEELNGQKVDAGMIKSLRDQLAQAKSDLASFQAEFASLMASPATEESANRMIVVQDALKQTEAYIRDLEKAIGYVGSAGNSAADDLSSKFKKAGKQIAAVAKRILIYQTLYKVLNYIKDTFSDVLKSDAEFQEKVEELRAAFYTVSYAIVDSVIPALETIVDIVKDWLVSVGTIAAALKGVTYSELVDQAKASKEAADNYEKVEESVEEASKQLTSFDDIEILSDDSDENDGGSSGFDKLKGGDDGGDDYDGSKEKTLLDTILATVGGSLVAIGIILLANGQIGWGLGFIIVGAVIHNISEKKYEAYDAGSVGEMVLKIEQTVGTVLCAIGIILLKHGQILWGLGFIIAGAAIYAIGEVWGKKYSGDDAVDLLTKIEKTVAIALCAVGIILCILQQWVWGIGFIIAGAAIYGASEISANWDDFSPKVQNIISIIAAAVGAAMIALGVVLCCVGQLPWGIAAILVGLALVTTAVVLNWDSIKEKVIEIWNSIKEWIDTYGKLVLGIVLCLTGLVGIGFGIKLILDWAKENEGEISLADKINDIKDKVKEVWQNIKDYWDEHIAPIFTFKYWEDLAKKCGNGLIAGFENAINGIISAFEDMINWVVDGLNKISFKFPDWVPKLGGNTWGINIPNVSFGRISIPRLAEGAVIPANREFIAVLGDQKRGTNIEAPADLIKQKVVEALAEVNASIGSSGGNITVVLELDGREFGRAVVEQGNRENRRIGTRLVIV